MLLIYLDRSVPLTNPTQSTTYTWGTCTNDGCTAEKALDGDIDTGTLSTNDDGIAWWSARFTTTTVIDSIYVDLSHYYHALGSQLKVETKMKWDDEWKVCKAAYILESTSNPHDMKCSEETTANFIRLSVTGDNLRLNEVIVTYSSKLFHYAIPLSLNCSRTDKY